MGGRPEPDRSRSRRNVARRARYSVSGGVRTARLHLLGTCSTAVRRSSMQHVDQSWRCLFTVPRSITRKARQHHAVYDVRTHRRVFTRLIAQVAVRRHLPTRLHRGVDHVLRRARRPSGPRLQLFVGCHYGRREPTPRHSDRLRYSQPLIAADSEQPRPSCSVTDTFCRTSTRHRCHQIRHTSVISQRTTARTVRSLFIDVALGLLCSNHCALVPGNRRSWRSFNFDDFVRDLQQSTLVCSPPTGVDELVAAYDDTLKSLLDVHAPYRVVRQSTRQSQHWFDAECRAVKRTTRKLERAYRRHPTIDSLDAWKSQFSMQRHLFRQKATDYWSTTFADCRGDAKLLWSHINRATNPPTARRTPHTEHELAIHFTSKVDKIRTSTSLAGQPDISVRHCAALSSFQHVTADEVRQLVRRAPCKHCALDPVPTWLLKRAIDVLAPTIAAVCNSSLQAGHFPDSQKQARLTARLKKPSLNPDDLNSFRPISNLTFLSKIVERIVVKQFTHHADLHGLFPPNQSAYRQFHSTESAVLLVHNDIVRAIDRGHNVALVLLDLSSAFDTVDHRTLLTILQSRFSVTNQPLQWFHSYLTGRTQVFTTHSSQTLPIPLTTGVPQGSSLGPTQFIAYTESTSEIFSSHSVQYHLFADDTQVYDHCEISAIPSLLARLSSCIDDLAQSFASLRLQLNPSKTEFIWFASHSNLAKIPDNCQSIRIRESIVRSTDTVRDLGVFLDSELSMKHHISKTASACFFHLRRLRQIRGRVTDEVMMQLLSSLVLSRLDYCNVVLAGLPASTLQPLQKVQNAAARLILGLDRRSHITPALKKLHWLPVKDRITFKVATIMHQILNHRCPPYLTSLIDFNTAGTQHRQLRSASTRAAVVLRSRTEFGKRAFSVCGPTVWNRLPPNLRAIDNHSAFRRGLKTHLFHLAF